MLLPVVMTAVTVAVTVFTSTVEEVVALVAANCKMPPIAPPGGEDESVAFLARDSNATRVLPDVGALMEPTMPD